MTPQQKQASEYVVHESSCPALCQAHSQCDHAMREVKANEWTERHACACDGKEWLLKTWQEPYWEACEALTAEEMRAEEFWAALEACRDFYKQHKKDERARFEEIVREQLGPNACASGCADSHMNEILRRLKEEK